MMIVFVLGEVIVSYITIKVTAAVKRTIPNKALKLQKFLVIKILQDCFPKIKKSKVKWKEESYLVKK